MPKIQKAYITWQEFWELWEGTWTPSAHTHVKADITDTPWAWADVLKTGSNLTDLATRQHAGLTNVTSDQHHPQSHTLASHSTKPHSALTDVLENQHHNKVHALTGSYHTASGLTIGWVIKATGATTFAWGQLPHDKLAGLGDDDHTHYLLASGARALTGNWDAGAFQVRALKFYSDQATGTAPFTVLSTTKVANLNVDRLDDLHAASFALTTRKLDDFGEPDDNIDLNVSIHRHGLFPKLPNEWQEFFSGTGQWHKLVSSSGIAIYVLSGVSTTTRNSNDATKSTASIGWVKIKEVKLGEPAGKMKIYFWLISAVSGTVYGRIRVNGEVTGDWGTSTQKSTTTAVACSDDLGPFDSQDLIQIYAKCEEEEKLVEVQDMRFKYDRAITYFGDWEIATPIPTVLQTVFIVQNQDP